MTKLVPVDFDPFAGEDASAQQQEPTNVKLTPVDGNPFAEEDEAALVAAYNRRNPNDTVESLPDRSGVLGRAAELGMGMVNAVRDQFPQDMARIARGFTGGTPGDDSYFTKVIEENQRDMKGRLPSKQVVGMDTLAESLSQGPASIATSLATGVAGGMLGAKAGALAGSPGGPSGAAAGGVIGAMVGAGTLSGAAFYNLAKDQFLDEMYQKAQKANPNLTQEDWKALSDALDADATEFGLWEAGPEAVSQFFTAGLVKGVGGKVLSKMFPGAAGGIARIGENAIARATAKLAAEVGEEEVTEATTFMGQEGIRQRVGLRDDAPTLREFANTQAGPVAVGSVLQIGGMSAAERANAWRKGIGGDTFVDETVPIPTNKPINLLIPEVLPPEQNALPSGGQYALPEGTGAMPRGTDATGLSPIPTKADMPSGPTIAMQPTLALPQDATDAPAGMWPGGRSQLSYPYGGGMRNDIAGVAPEEVMPIGGANDQHKALVAEALNSGKEVPIDVLGAYGMAYPMAQEQTLADEVAALPSMDDGDPFAPAEPAQAMAIEEQGVATDTLTSVPDSHVASDPFAGKSFESKYGTRSTFKTSSEMSWVSRWGDEESAQYTIISDGDGRFRLTRHMDGKSAILGEDGLWYDTSIPMPVNVQNEIFLTESSAQEYAINDARDMGWKEYPYRGDVEAASDTQAVPTAAQGVAPSSSVGGFDLKPISDKAFVVTGDTKPIKEQLKSAGGKWNSKHRGWMFSNKRQQEVESLLAGIGQPTATAPEVRNEAQAQAEALLGKEQIEPAQAQPASESVKKGVVGGRLSSGDVVLTSTGRKTSPFPKVDLGGERKALNTLKRVDRWLIQNAIDEADSRGDDFAKEQFQASLDNPQQADKDAAEYYLFDKDFIQKPAPRFLKPLINTVSPENVESLNRGDVVTSGDGRQFAVWDVRHGVLTAHPIVDGKPSISADTIVKFNIDDRAKARNEEYRSDTLYFSGQKAQPAQEAAPVMRQRESMNTQADEDKRLVALGQKEVPGIRLGDALDAGRVAEARDRGDVSREEWDSYVADLVASGRVTRQDDADSETVKGTKVIAQRMDNAVLNFVGNVQEQFGFTEDEAKAILAKFVEVKAVNLDPVMGVYKLKDGRFWDKEVMRRALGVAEEAQPAAKEEIASPKADAVESKQEESPKEVDSGTAYEEPRRVPAVERATDMADGQPAGSSAGNVQEPEETDGIPGRAGDASRVGRAPRKEGGDSRGRSSRNQHGDGRASGRTGTDKRESAGTDADGRAQEVPDLGRQSAGQNAQNHRVAEGDTIVPGGTVARAKANIAAIKLLKELQAENRAATPEEKRVLTQFTGWGSLAQEVFKPEFDNAAEYEGRYGRTYPSLTYNRQASEAYDKWKERYGKALHPALGGMMTAEEWDAAKKSTLNAHYTDRSVINAMWSMAERMGFTGGRVLEPSAGTGLFFGLMPEGISEKSRLVGVELDSITGGILQKLYPDADIQVTGFENAKRIGDNSFDMVISNFPFGSFQVYDKARPEYSKQSIHNYFFSRAIDAVKPGGLVMGITSHFTLDAGGTGKVREMWGQKADLVAAVRLPGTAFEKNAGTQVTTDIIILRKKTDTPYQGEQFRHLAEVQTPEGPTQINEYFVQHPEMVLGEHSLQGSMYGGKDEYTLKPSKGEALDAAMKRVAELLPQNIAGRDIAVANDIAPVQAADDGMREGTIVEKGGKVFMVVDGALEAPEWASNAKKASQAKDYLGVKSAALELINAMNTEYGDANVNRLRARLNEVYDAYVKEHGHINKRGNKHLEDDLEFPTVAALETIGQIPVDKEFQTGPKKGQKYTVRENVFSKADIFSKRTIYPFTEPTTAESLSDAVKISRVYRNGVNVPYIARLLRMDVEDARAALLKTGDVFENPENGLVEPKDIYLSGNVREKLRIAERAAEDNPAYMGNVEALQKVMPERLSIDAIHVRIGSAWVPAEIIKSFMEHIGISYPRVERIRIDGEEGSTQWAVDGTPGADARNRWGVDGASALDLVSDSLNLKRAEVFDTFYEDNKSKRVKNPQKSLAAQEKQRALQEEFRRWVKENDEAAKKVEDVYNDTFNGHVARKFDAPDIKYYPGASQTIELRENQKTGVSRALQESTLLAHGVGSGKTFLLITLAMEMRRLGTAKKPWIVVQGSTLPQFAASFKRLYPGARILAPNEEQRKAKNRQRLLAQIASGDWDAVITPHGFFNSISIDPENEARFINERIEEFEEQIRADYGDKALTNKRDNNPTVKAIQRKIEKMKVRLQKLTDTKKDANIFFEQLGVDALIIDEAHAYKRGDFYTKMDNVKGLDRDSSQRSMQMLMKSRHVQGKTGGKNVVMATGTPISNTLTEMWTMFRYTRPDLLRAFGVEQFDDFASTFADTTVSLEETSTGDFKDVERFNRFVNGPELLTMWRMGADVAITENLNYIKGLPKLAGGKVQEVAVERSEALTNYIRSLKAERDAWDQLSGKEKRDSSHVPLVIYGKAKKAAIDLRLVDADLADTPGSKANAVVDSVFERWQQHKDTKAAQIIFSDIFQSSDKRFNLFHDIRDKLIARGVPAGEIAIIHDFKTDDARGKLFDKVNAGTVRVLMGTTEKLGVGVNVQERLVAAHHIDAPLRPMDFEQRNGRIRRPGNMFPEVEVFAYGTKNTLDSVTFQQLIAKQKFINQVMRGDMGNRVFENPFDEVQSTFEDMMAAFSGNPLAKEKMKLQADIRRLESLHSAYTSRLSNMRYELRHAKTMLDGAQKQLPKDEKAVAFVEKNFPGGKVENRKEIMQAIGEWLESAENTAVQSIADVKSQDHWRTLNPKKLSQTRTFVLGNGMKAEVTVTPGVYFDGEGKVEERYAMTSYELAGPHGIEDSQAFTGASGMMTRVENFLSRVMDRVKMTEKLIANQQKQIASLEAELKKPFEQAKELDQAHTRMDEIEAALAASANEDLEAAKASQEEQHGEDGEQNYFRPQYSRGENASGLDAKEVNALAKPLLELLTDSTKVRIVQAVADLPEGLRKNMVRDKAENVLGAFYGGTNYLIADNIPTAEDVMFVLKHELFHDGMRRMRERYAKKYGRDEAFKKMNLFLDLAFAANKKEILKLADAYRHDFPDLSEAKNRRGLTEEWLGNMAHSNAPKWYDRYVAAVRQFLRAVADRLGIKLRFSDSELRDFIRRVQSETGDYGKDGSASYARPESASTAGAATAAEAEEAARLWAEMGTESPYFKRWFGESKVVDEQGKPLVVYHWTDSIFESFSRTSDIGYHFGTKNAAKDRGAKIGGASVGVEPDVPSAADKATAQAVDGKIGGNPVDDLYALMLRKLDSPRIDLRTILAEMSTAELEKTKDEYLEKPDSNKLAERVARGRRGTSFNVVFNGEIVSTHKSQREARARADKLTRDSATPMAVYLSMSNPIRLPDLGVWSAQEIAKESGFSASEIASVAEAGSQHEQYAKVREILSARGYDGILYTNEVEDMGSDSYIAFSPTQIKSVNNRGTFDANDPRISYMRPEGMPSAKDVAQVVDGFETGDIGELGPLLRLPHWLAKKVPSLRKVVDRQFEREERRSSALSQSIEAMPELFGKDRLKGDERQKLIEFLWKWDGKNVKVLDETPKFIVAEERGNRLLLKKNTDWDKAYAEWVKSEGLSGKVASAAINVRKALDDAFVRGYNRLALMAETPDTMLEEMRSLFMHLDNYMPHSRTGAYGVAVYDKDGEALYREHFDAPNKAVAKIRADKRLKELRKKYPEAGRFWAGVNKGMPEEIYEQLLSMDAMEKMLFAAVDKSVDDAAVAADLKKGITMAASDEFKSRGWLSHSIGRKNVPGFERENIEKVLFDYFAGHHGFLEKVDAAKDMASALKKIDPKTRPNEHAYVVQYVKDMLRNSDKIDRVVGNIKALAFVWYLGGVMKTAAVNATQNIVSGAPTLGLWTKGSSHVRIFDAAMRSVVKGRLSEDEQRLVKELHENGLTQANLIREVQGRVSGKFGSVGNRVISALGWPMAAAERFNRVSLALAAYRAARSGALNDKALSEFGVVGKADYEQAKAFAESIVRDAHFVYGKSNLPQPLRSSKAGRVASAAYTFRSFNHNMLEMWANALVRHGWQDGGKAVLSSMAGTMVLGGLRAAPFFATAMALTNWLAPLFGGSGDDDWLEKIAKMLPKADWMRDMILFGVPSLAGVDIGGSLRLEAPMVDRSAKYRHGDVLGDIVGEALGIPYALVQSVGRAKSAVEAGAPARAVEEIAPVALKNAMAAYRLSTEGAHSITGTPIKDPLTQKPKTLSATEAVFKSLGFQAVSQTKASLTQNAVDRTEAVRADKAKLLSNRIANAARDNNIDAVKANLRAWKEWNAKAKSDGKPSLLILPQDMKSRLRARLSERKTSPRQAMRIMQLIDAYGK